MKNDDEINELCLQWVAYMPGTTTQGVTLLVYGTDRKAYRKWVLYIHHLKFISFSLPDVGWSFYSLLLCNYHITGIAGTGQVQELRGDRST